MSLLVYRIAADTPTYTADDLTGAGAKISGGRWNNKGTAMLYTSSSIALACLETIAHLGPDALPLNRYLVRIEIPDDVLERRLTLDDLASSSARVGWEAEPPGSVSLNLGTNWVTSGASAVLEVPSVIVEEESNFLINPAHPDSMGITAVKIRRILYDARLR